MESQGFRRGLNSLILNEGLDIDLITTDRAPSVRKIMREEFQNIHHEFDPWHVTKGKELNAIMHVYCDGEPSHKTQLHLHLLIFCVCVCSLCSYTGIKKKLVALANKKENRDLQGWLRSILNHFWFSLSSCGGNAEVGVHLTINTTWQHYNPVRG